MLKIIRLFMVIIYSCTLAVPASLTNPEKLKVRARDSHNMRIGSRHEQKYAGRQDGRNGDAPACKLCADPCALKSEIEKGSVKDERGKRIERIWVIDARPGIISRCGDNATYYASSPRTRVFIINMNPFAFDYDITKQEDKVAETAQIAFLKLLGTPISDAIGDKGVAGTATAASGLRAEDPKCATDMKDAENYLNKQFVLDETLVVKSFTAWMNDLKNRLKGYQSAYDGVRKAYISLLDRWATCEELCEAMDSFEINYKKFQDKYDFEDLALKVKQIETRLVSEFKARFPQIDDCPDFAGSNLQATLTYMRREIEKLNDKLKVLCNNVFKADNWAKLAAIGEAIDTVRKHPEILLTQTFDVGGYADATRVKITVEPKIKQLRETFSQVEGEGPQPCDTAGSGQSSQRQGGQQPAGEDTPRQPVTEAPPQPSPSPTP